MSVIVIGMEMPVFEHQSWDIRKGEDGKWYMVDTNAETSDGEWHEIIHVPPHGRLVDADELRQSIKENIGECHKWADEMREAENDEMVIRAEQSLGTFVECGLRVKNAPTIIPADPLKEEA